jgi:hypothetical protein
MRSVFRGTRAEDRDGNGQFNGAVGFMVGFSSRPRKERAEIMYMHHADVCFFLVAKAASAN